MTLEIVGLWDPREGQYRIIRSPQAMRIRMSYDGTFVQIMGAAQPSFCGIPVPSSCSCGSIPDWVGPVGQFGSAGRAQVCGGRKPGRQCCHRRNG